MAFSADDAPPPPAATLAGLLADPARRRVVAALTLGARSPEQVRSLTALPARDFARAVRRLVDAGLVIEGDDRELFLVEAAFGAAARAAARAAASSRPAVDDHADAPSEEARVLRVFVRGGRLLSIPTVRSKRLVVLEWLAQQFEPGRRYREPVVNLLLGRFHADTAALRRYLVDEGFLARAGGEYWRIGGRVEI